VLMRRYARVDPPPADTGGATAPQASPSLGYEAV
jgi:hypothetical protein